MFLGGSASPIGRVVNFIEAPLDEVVAALTAFRSSTGSGGLRVDDASSLDDSLDALDPMEAPWTVEMLIECPCWTAYLKNGLGGGDPTASADEIARQLDTRCVMAMHAPRYGPGHAATQLWICGPDGEPPLMYVRTVAVQATDGRWTFTESGTPQPWEDRYRSRLKRDRFDRALLVGYLEEMDIHVDAEEFFGRGVAIRKLVDWPTRQVSIEAWNTEHDSR